MGIDLINLTGTTSGAITMQPQAAAGTYNWNYPITAGTAGYFLTSQGGTVTPMNWTNPASLSTTVDNQTCAISGTCSTPGFGSIKPAISSCGTGTPVVITGSNNRSGQFTLGTGTPSACTITFDNGAAFANYAFCTISAASSSAAAITGGNWLSAQSKSAFTLTLGAGVSSATFAYNCQGY